MHEMHENETPQISPEDIQAVNKLSDDWLRELIRKLESLGIEITDYLIMVHAFHAIAHVFMAVPGLDTIAMAADEAACWYEDCTADWTETEFAAMIERGALTLPTER